MDRKQSIRLLICVVVLATQLLVFVPSAFAADESFYTTRTSNLADGWVYKYDSSYYSAHVSSVGTVIDDEGYFEVGQSHVSTYGVHRGFIFFSTSVIPDTATIDNATLSLYVFEDMSSTDFNVTIQDGQPTYPHDTLQSGDYDKDHYAGDGGSRNTTDGLSASNYWNITFSEDGLDFIQVDGTTKLCLRSSRDIGYTTPAEFEYVLFSSSESSHPPLLTVGFTVEEGSFYAYTFYGPFDEETGLALGETVDVTAYNTEGGALETFELDGSDTFYSILLVQYFRFVFEDNSTREYWVDPSESSSSTIYVFWGDTTTYSISFLDTTGILNTYPYVTIKRYVNGTLYTIEKRKADIYDNIIANLINGRTYQIVLGNEAVTYIFGDLTMTSLTTVQLTLKGADFPKESLLQKFVRMYTLRESDGTTLYIYYSDSSEKTYNVSVTLYTGGLVEVYSYTFYNNSFCLTYPVTNTTHYLVTATICHQTYGEMDYKQLLMGVVSPVTFDLGFLGDWGFDSYMLLPSLLILCLAGCFSKVNAYVGCLLMVILASVLSYLGWFPVPAGLLVAGFFLAVLMGLLYQKRGVRQY